MLVLKKIFENTMDSPENEKIMEQNNQEFSHWDYFMMDTFCKDLVLKNYNVRKDGRKENKSITTSIVEYKAVGCNVGRLECLLVDQSSGDLCLCSF